MLERDLTTGAETEIVPSGIADTINGGGLSADGRYVAYDLRKDEAYKGLYVKDVDTGQARRADTSADGTAGDGYSALVRLFDDGRRVIFNSTSSNVTPGAPGRRRPGWAHHTARHAGSGQ